MITRREFIEGKASFEEYYNDVLDELESSPYGFCLDIPEDIIKKCKEHIDEDIHLNFVPLKEWDRIAEFYSSSHSIHEAFEKRGDYVTLGGMVCLVKQYVRRKIKQEVQNGLDKV